MGGGGGRAVQADRAVNSTSTLARLFLPGDARGHSTRSTAAELHRRDHQAGRIRREVHRRPSVRRALGLYTELNNRRRCASSTGRRRRHRAGQPCRDRIYGLEADVNFRLVDNLRFEGNLTCRNTNTRVRHHSGVHRQRARAPAELPLQRRASITTTAASTRRCSPLTPATISRPIEHRSASMALTSSTRRRLHFDWADDAVASGSTSSTCSTTTPSPKARRVRTIQTAGGAYFVGRPVLPRRIAAVHIQLSERRRVSR